MPANSTADLINSLEQSGLLDSSQSSKLKREFIDRTSSPEELSNELIQRGWLTHFQAGQLAQGRFQKLVLGPYLLLDRVGRGGMGEVFKAKHKLMNRIVALKVIRNERLASPEAVARFRREIRAAARVSHPHLVIAHDAAQDGDSHYFVMEYVEGVDLRNLVKKSGPLPIGQACECIRQAALGLQHVHECGLVHRDIKPANLFLTRGSGAKTAGIIKILDLGLARLYEEEDQPGTALTRLGDVMGTPDYLAPEQARDSHRADIRSDIYSLGCTFYYLLTGKPPFPGGSLTEKLLKHREIDPVPVEVLRPDVPPDLGNILRKMMAKQPTDRYQTPQEIAEAIKPFCGAKGTSTGQAPVEVSAKESDSEEAQALLSTGDASNTPSSHFEGKPGSQALSERRPPAANKAPSRSPPIEASNKRWRRFAPWAALAALLVVGGVVLFGQIIIRIRDKDGKGIELVVPEGSTTKLGQDDKGNTTVDVTLGSGKGKPSSMPTDSPLDALKPDQISEYERKIAGSADPSHVPEGLVAIWGDSRLKHWGAVFSVAPSPDGQRVASAGADKVVRIWDANTGQQVLALAGHEGAIRSVAFSPDGKRLVSGGDDQTVRFLDAETGRETATFAKHTGTVCSVAFSPDGKSVASASADQTVKLWDAATGKELFTLKGHTDEVRSVALSSDGTRLASGSADQTIKLWDTTTGQEIATLKGHSGPVQCVAFHPVRPWLASGSDDRTVKVWDAASGQERLTFKGNPSGISGLAFSPDGNRLAATCRAYSAPVKVWDAEQGRELLAIKVAEFHYGLAFTRDGKRLITAGLYGRVHLWDAEMGKALTTYQGHAELLTGLAFSPNGKQLASCSVSSVWLWDPVTNQGVPVPSARLDHYGNVTFRPDGQELAWSDIPEIEVWQPGSRSNSRILARASGWLTGLAYSPNSQRLAVSHVQGIGVYDTTTGQQLLATHAGQRADGVAYSPNGRWLAAIVNPKQVTIWDALTGQEFRSLARKGAGREYHVAFSPDSQFLAIPGRGSVQVWDVEGKAMRGFGHPRAGVSVNSVAYSPNGKTLASADADGHVIWWDNASQKKLREWSLPGSVERLAFAPDGRHLALGNSNGTVYLLRLSAGDR